MQIDPEYCTACSTSSHRKAEAGGMAWRYLGSGLSAQHWKDCEKGEELVVGLRLSGSVLWNSSEIPFNCYTNLFVYVWINLFLYYCMCAHAPAHAPVFRSVQNMVCLQEPEDNVREFIFSPSTMRFLGIQLRPSDSAANAIPLQATFSGQPPSKDSVPMLLHASAWFA